MKPLTILVSPFPAVGHVNACSGALSDLLERGHRVIFILTKSFEGKLAKLGYEEYIMPPNEKLSNTKFQYAGKNPGTAAAELFLAAKIIGPYSPLEKEQNMASAVDRSVTQDMIVHKDKCVREAIALLKPDLIYVDGGRIPAILYSGIPWILHITPQPLANIYDENLPLVDLVMYLNWKFTKITKIYYWINWLGLPIDGDRSEWAEWSEIRWKTFRCKKLNDIYEKMGYPRYPNDLYPQTQILTVYALPEEINYPQFRAKELWFNIEVFNKPDKCQQLNSLESSVPKEFLDNDLDGNFSGKLIYLSLGSMGSIDLDLMKRLIGPLGQTNHKYIVSKGPRHSEYELARNMWGEEFLPQSSILPHVHLVISHGGNNTVTEVFAEGKPMIVLPLFSDQYDNAQRLKEIGYGARIDPYHFQDDELISAIDKMLGDENLHKKLEAAAKRIQTQNKHKQLSLKIEQLLN